MRSALTRCRIGCKTSNQRLKFHLNQQQMKRSQMLSKHTNNRWKLRLKSRLLSFSSPPPIRSDAVDRWSDEPETISIARCPSIMDTGPEPQLS